MATNLDKKLGNPKARLYLLGAFLLLWMAAIALRLFSLQVIHYNDWLLRAQRQQQRTVEITPERGVIYDRNGQALAMSVQVDSVFAVPGDVPDHATTAALLAEVLGTKAGEIQSKLDSGKSFVWIARKVDPSIGTRLRELNLKGIYFQKEPKRFYPKRELAAQVLGYVGLDDEGLGGIELNFDNILRGTPGRMEISLDARRKRLGRVELQPVPGQNIVLTIDQNIQYIAERELEQAMKDTHAEAATIVVQNPHTGEILALANRPTFNPNTFAHVPQAQLQNRAVSDIYEPGSMFKTVTISAALEEKVTRPDERFDVSQGYIMVGGIRMRDSHRMGILTVGDVIAQSSNVGAIKIGMRLGQERLYKYIRAYGYGSLTGIELPGESRGLVKPIKRWSETSIGAMSIGQEVGITAIQAVSAISSIANDGVWNAPRIVAGITPPNSGPQTITFHPAEQRRVVSPLTAVEMKKMMEGVVLYGTARRAILDGYTSAGKTGTAQKIDPRTGRYSATKYVATFAGFAPVNEPAVTIAVIIDSAVGLHQGGQVSAPVFQRVAQQVLEYLHVPYDTELKNQNRLQLRATVKDQDLEDSPPDHLGEPLQMSEATQQASTADQQDKPQSSTHGAAQFVPANVRKPTFITPAAAAAIPSAPSGSLASPRQPGPEPASGVVVNVDDVVVPAFLGRPLRSAVELAEQAGIVLDAVGFGVARDQSPAPGTRIPKGGHVAVRFAR